jgi:antitoxin CptB
MNDARRVRAFGVGLTMTDMPANEDIEVRKRRILFRAWHRGTREMDLILGRFADVHVSRLGEREIEILETLMEMPDPDIYNWIIGAKPAPPEFDTPLLKQIRDFHLDGRRDE